MRALICKWLGHRWALLYRLGPRGGDFYVCVRCKEPGWMV